MSQAINLRATQWAYEQTGLCVTAKAVLTTFAMHADERGYTWPSVDRIASTWGMDRETVRRQIDALLVRRKICRTKKRCGSTGQVKVYRLPKITWGSGGKSTRLQNDQSGAKAEHKRGISGGKSAPNNDNDGTKNKYHDHARTRTRGTINAQAVALPTPESDFVFEGYQNQNQPAQNHVKWPEFAKWCRSKDGQPTEAGFWKWLCGQKPQWRNKVRKDFDETGYVLDGKFLTPDEANRLGTADPGRLVKFQPAVRRDGKIQILQPR